MKDFIIIILVVFNISCIYEQTPKSETFFTSRNGTSQSEALSRRGSVSRLCSGDSTCQGICEDLFSKQNERERCFNAPKVDVDQFESILKVLKDPLDGGSLSLIKTNAFESLLKVSLSLWIPITRNASSRDAKVLLGWIASNPNVSRHIHRPYFYNHESVWEFFKYEGIENLLIKIGGARNCQSIYNSIRMANIAGQKSFWDITLTTNVNNTVGRGIVCEIFQRYCSETRPSSRTASDSWTTAYYDMHNACLALQKRASVGNKQKCREALKRRNEAQSAVPINRATVAAANEDVAYYCTD